ncbi:DUF6404 family protein [Vibrio japonicus]|uniref:DUF6404 family protein n=1 Tax=Vibrio japonicus TaxID=1824638 RepID=A0ABY5LMG6_9VIBR|nr:DUF6404 family protein [Vibrio japonicus]UUM31983.1 DUF6404 family protein [Vibrio japonicus]
MSYETKLDKAVDELERAGIRSSSHHAFSHRFLRKLGIQVRPSYYEPIWRNFLVLSAEFFVLFFAFSVIFRYDPPTDTYLTLANEVMLGTSAYALLMCLYYIFMARRCNLTPWNKL